MWLYEKNQDNTARYILGEQGTRPLVCIGINPSTAEPDHLDPTLCAAWGTVIHKRRYPPGCLEKIAETQEPFHPKWITIGRRSKHGHPRHPLYLSYAEKVTLFDIAAYLSQESELRRKRGSPYSLSFSSSSRS